MTTLMVSMGNGPNTTEAGRRCRTRQTSITDRTGVDLDQIIERYGRLVASAARKVVGPTGDIDDVAQETWIVYLQSGHQVVDERCLSGWLHTVATRIAIRSNQRNGRTVAIDDLGSFAADDFDSTDIDSELLRSQRRSAIDDACESMRDRDRQILKLLLDDAGLDYRQVSERSGVPIGSLGPTRERLIRKLRQVPALRRLADDGDEGEVHALSSAA